VNKKNGNARTRISDIAAGGFELGAAELAMVCGGTLSCGGDTPYETPTATLNSEGMPDTQTDCTSRPPLTRARG
jgi:hypothetical protein